MSSVPETTIPKITVLMPVYNAEKTLREAMDSILAQSFTDFEFLIIDDGSSDGSVALIRSYADPRVRLVQNERNLKLTATLNGGLDLARGEYVARMDADDISLPARFARQVAFLDAHPEVGICGTWAWTFGEAQFAVLNPADPARVRRNLLFDSALVHPSVMMRRSLLDAHGLRYAPLGHFEDYELWQRAARLFPIANIPEDLFRYRITKGSALHGGDPEAQRAAYRRIDEAALPFLGITPTPAQLDIHNYLRSPDGRRNGEAEAWLLTLDAANRRSGYDDPAGFAALLHDRWLLASYRTPGTAWTRWRRYARSPLVRRVPASPLMRLRRPTRFLLQPLRQWLRSHGVRS